MPEKPYVLDLKVIFLVRKVPGEEGNLFLYGEKKMQNTLKVLHRINECAKFGYLCPGIRRNQDEESKLSINT